MWQYNKTENLYPDELYHYGVLGMKWGMRRAYKKGVDYQYKSHGQKKYEKKVEKLTSKINKRNKKPSFATKTKLDRAKNKLEMYKGRDKNRQDYAKTASLGKSMVKTVLFGPFGSGNYNRFRSSGHGRIVSALGANFVASTLGYPVTALISKSAENKSGRTRAIAEGRIESKKKK